MAWVIALTGQIIVSLQSTFLSLTHLHPSTLYADPVSASVAHTPIPNISSSGSLPPGVTLPPGFTLPPGITLPPGFTLLSLPSFFPVTNTPGTLWFALIAQGLVFLQLISALYSNTIRAHTPLITTFAAIVIVLAAFGVDNNLFSPATSQKLTAAGWLMTAIIDCLWVLCLTAGEGTRTRRVFDFLIGGGGLFGIRQEISPIFETKFSSVLGRVPGSRMRRSQRMAHDASPKVVIPMFDKPREAISPDAPAPPPSEGTRTNRSQRGSTIPSRVASPVGGGTRTSSLMQAEDHGSVGTKPENMSIPVEPLRALALYPCTFLFMFL